MNISHTTAVFTNGAILSCGGGYSPFIKFLNAMDECFIYHKHKGWSELSRMKQGRYYSASIPIDGGMIVTGGLDCHGRNLKSSEIVLSDGSAVRHGPELPEPRSGHCLAYDKKNNVFFITGGGYGYGDQYDSLTHTLLDRGLSTILINSESVGISKNGSIIICTSLKRCTNDITTYHFLKFLLILS